MENPLGKMENPLSKNGKFARWKWKIRSGTMENALSKNKESAE
jgi:hypothetical protein